MIDDKKIEEAAFEETFGMYGEGESLESGFIRGAKWMQEEFLKDLWHPASEEPRQKAMLLIEISLPKLTPRKSYYADILIGEDWEITCSTMCISRWLYVDDLLSKKGGGQ